MIKLVGLALTVTLTALFLGATGTARADTTLDVSIGWEGQTRADRWAPVFVTAASDKPRNAILRVKWPSTVYTMDVRQFVTVDSGRRTFKLALPVRGWGYTQASFELIDASNGKTLASYPADYSNAQITASQIGEHDVMVGISGRRTGLQTLQTAASTVKTAYLEPLLFPESAMGLDALDVLVLNEPNLKPGASGGAALSDDQQQAIVDWVRAGGHLVLWPGENRFPEAGPLADVFPAKMGALHQVELAAHDLLTLGLLERFRRVSVFQLHPQPGAKAIKLLGSDALQGYQQQVGLGRITLSPINIGELLTDDVQACRKIWTPLLGEGVLSPNDNSTATPGQNQPANPYQYQQNEQQQQWNTGSRIADFLGDIKGAGSIGFSYIAAVMIGLLLLVGPIDWIVLKRLRRQPWTWITTGGWIALLTLGAVFAAHFLKSGVLDFRTLRLVDQVNDATVASTDFVSLYSPRTQDYEFQTSGGWWTPAAEQEYGRGVGQDIPFQQIIDSNTPMGMSVHIWSLRFLRGDTLAAGPAMLRADLRINRHDDEAGASFKYSGVLRNLTDRPLRHLTLTSAHGAGTLKLYADGPSTTERSTGTETFEVPPHAKVFVEAAVSRQLVVSNAENENSNYYYYNNRAAPTESEVGTLACKLDIRRAKRIDSLIQAGDHVCIFGELGDPAPVVMLDATPDHQQHWQFIRAVVGLAGEREGP